jgi:hypothetical protein
LTDICELRAGAISVPWEERQVIEENDNGHERRKEKAQMVFLRLELCKRCLLCARARLTAVRVVVWQPDKAESHLRTPPLDARGVITIP